uniref:Acyl-CoA-binding domain-containing protein 6 n=1 Tax=Onchocerca volvulus TaxID=6282 RepID=A0A2K6WF68_ONCVO
MEATIRKKLEIALKPSHLDIEDFSDGCGLKFRLVIVSDSFDNKTTLASHRLVYDVLKEEMQAIHALEIKTYTHEKWTAIDESEKKKTMFVYQLLKWTSGSSNSEGEEQQPEEEISEKLAAEFASACTYLPIAFNDGLVSREDQIYFYARYKLITHGKADPSKRPRIYDVINREKFDAWSALSNMSRAEAMRQYVAKLVELNLGWDANETYHIRFGVRPSTMADAESTETESSGLSLEQIEWFAALDEGNIEKLRSLLAGNLGLLNGNDENQLSALHWASDRGRLELVDFLVDAGADVNIQDYSGQTPLHYVLFNQAIVAVSCSHRSVVDFLLKKGADPTIADFEGNCPLDIVSDTNIRRMLEDALLEGGPKS